MQAKMRLVSLRDVEDGVAHARSTADQHALDMSAAEHERLIIPLREKFTALDRTSATTRAGLQETTRTLREHEARLASLEAQKRSTAAAIAVARRTHASYISGLSAQQPAPANPAILVAPAAQQPLAPANLATFVAPTTQQPLAPANLATSVVPAAQQPLSAGFTAPTTTQRQQPPASAAAKPSAPTAPAVTFAARTTMPPPTSTAPWSVVAARNRR